MDEKQLKKLRNAMDIVKNNANWGDCYEFKKDIDIILDYVDVLLEENNFLIRKNHKLDMELENAKEYADEVWRQNQDLEEEFNEFVKDALNTNVEEALKRNMAKKHCTICGEKLTKENTALSGMCMECKCGIDWEDK